MARTLKKKTFRTSISTLKYIILSISIFSSLFLAVLLGYNNYHFPTLISHHAGKLKYQYREFRDTGKQKPERKKTENYLNGNSEEEFQVKYAPKFILKNSAINPGYLVIFFSTFISYLYILITTTRKKLFLLRSPPV